MARMRENDWRNLLPWFGFVSPFIHDPFPAELGFFEVEEECDLKAGDIYEGR